MRRTLAPIILHRKVSGAAIVRRAALYLADTYREARDPLSPLCRDERAAIKLLIAVEDILRWTED